ncbi:MAG: SRPBCC family protein [Terriglobia bacterium]
MAMIVSKIEIACPPDEVFSYVTDPSRFAEWQEGVVDGCMEGGRSPVVGSKCTTTRRIGGAERAVTSKITEISPPRSWTVRGVDGPIRAIVKVTVEPLDKSLRSRVTIALDFEGHGIGKLLVPLVVRRQARNEMPANLKRLRERIESHSGGRTDQPEPERQPE